MPKGFQGAKRWLNQLVDFEKTRLRRFSAVEMKLERMQKLMQALGNPQDSVRCIHVAGTNGKGSVSHMVDNMMRGIGYTVGRYTSPHLIDVRERITVGGMEIDKAAFGDVITKIAEAAQSINFEPTFFEAITVIRHEATIAKIVENFDFTEGEEFEAEESEDTISLLNRYIQESEVDLDKFTITNILQDVYKEACEVE